MKWINASELYMRRFLKLNLMAHYISRGSIPPKRHTQFRSPAGKLYSEELVSTEGFSSDYSLLYHIHAPTQILSTDIPTPAVINVSEEKMLKHRSLDGFRLNPEDDYLESRKAILVNRDVHISLAAPRNSLTNYFYKNADADELIFIHEGNGKLVTLYGELSFTYGDYIHIPRGVIYQIQFDNFINRLFLVEAFSPIRYPKKYISKYGQLLENSPYCERDIKEPVFTDAKG